MELPS
jgi:hypothetical protein